MSVFDVISIIISAFAVILSLLSIVISIRIASKQNKVALLHERCNVLSKIESYVGSLSSWEYDYTWFENLSVTETQIKILFDQEIANYFVGLKTTSEELNILRGDYEHAEKKGDCRGRDCKTIDDEIRLKVSDEVCKFSVIKDKIYMKYMKI